MYNETVQCICANTGAVEKQQVLYKCVFVAFGIQHAMCIHHTVSYVVSNLQYFSTLSHKQYDKRKVTKQNVCFNFIYKNLSETFLILRRTEWDVIKKLILFFM